MKNLDCRVFKFKKWILPKTKSNNLINSSEITIGYFDFISVERINCCSYTPFLSYYNSSKNKARDSVIQAQTYHGSDSATEKSKTIDSPLDFTFQQFFAFTNISNEREELSKGVYSEKKLMSFWSDPSVIRFYSLLHIEKGADKNKVSNILYQVHNAFAERDKESYNSVCYFSLDYSDIIICTRDLSILRFTEALFTLNYRSEEKLVRDSFSLVCLAPNSISRDNIISLNNYDQITRLINLRISGDECGTSNLLSEHFAASYNIGVQNYEVFNQLIKDLEQCNIPFTQYRILGRHDIALYNDEANLVWLIIMQTLLDYYSSKSDSLAFDEKNVVFNCESFIRVPFPKKLEYSDTVAPQKYCNTKYDNAQKLMDQLIQRFVYQEIDGKCKPIDDPIHVTPIYTLRNSILGLLKNGFADDFVLCVFESFLSFLSYIGNKSKINYLNDKQFDFTFNSYFNTINSLINSAMHSDRQFIQSPSFNPVFFDAPPKLLAYYTSITHQIYDIICTGDDVKLGKAYSFVFQPSFNSNINIVRYSYYDSAPSDRLLSVMINEKELYDPHSLIRQINHEVAHFVGEGNRKRNLRKHCFAQCMLYDIYFDFFFKVTNEPVPEMLLCKCINDSMKLLANEDFYKSNALYFDAFDKLLYNIMFFLEYDSKVEIIIKNTLSQLKEISYSEIEIISTQLDYYLFGKRINLVSMNENIYCFDMLITVFSEIYADLQMILILNMEFDDYLKTFDPMCDNISDFRQHDVIYYRILNIAILMILTGRWKITNRANNSVNKNHLLEDIKGYLDYFCNKEALLKYVMNAYENNDVQKVFEELEEYKGSQWCGYHYWNTNIQKYILEVYKSSRDCYATPEKTRQIESLRANIRVVEEFNDAIDVFCTIQGTNEAYATEIYRLDETL